MPQISRTFQESAPAANATTPEINVVHLKLNRTRKPMIPPPISDAAATVWSFILLEIIAIKAGVRFSCCGRRALPRRFPLSDDSFAFESYRLS